MKSLLLIVSLFVMGGLFSEETNITNISTANTTITSSTTSISSPTVDYPIFEVKAMGSITKEFELTNKQAIVSTNREYALIIEDWLYLVKVSDLLVQDGKFYVAVSWDDMDGLWSPVDQGWGSPYSEGVLNFNSDCNICFHGPKQSEDDERGHNWCATSGRDDNKGLLNACEKAVVTDDGRFVLYGAGGRELWSTR